MKQNNVFDGTSKLYALYNCSRMRSGIILRIEFACFFSKSYRKPRIKSRVFSFCIHIPTAASRCPHRSFQLSLYSCIIYILNRTLQIYKSVALQSFNVLYVLNDVIHLGFYHMQYRVMPKARIWAQQQRHVGIAR